MKNKKLAYLYDDNDSYMPMEFEEVAQDLGYGVIKLNSIQDQIKFEALKEKFYDIPESDLDDFLSKY